MTIPIGSLISMREYKMKRILLITVSLSILTLTVPALAADLPAQVYTKAPASSPEYDWSGFYAGVFGGYGYGDHNLNNALGTAGNAKYTVNYSSQGGVAGGFAGYNWQFGHTIVGLEGDYAWSGIKGNDAFALGSNDATNLRSVGTVRARAGFTVDRFMFFVTGGWAYGDIQHTNTDPVLGVDQFTVNKSGWTFGGGLEYAVTQNLLAKFEYRYTDFGGYSRAGTPLLTPNGQLPFTIHSTYSTVALGLAYKFGGPVVAKF
jgi:outer membrane immunogenic protein